MFSLEAKNDKCGICNGDNSQCKSVEGVFDERQISPGYHDIVVLPLGATSIKYFRNNQSKTSLTLELRKLGPLAIAWVFLNSFDKTIFSK